MKIKFLLFSIFTTVSFSINAQSVNSDAAGYLDRGNAMLRDKNYTGVSQQMKQLAKLHPTIAQSEEARRLWAIASLHLPGKPDALVLIDTWLRDFPGSNYYSEMKALKGDYYFYGGEYYKAIEIYNSINPALVNPRVSGDITYRLAYSKMMLGESDSARELFLNLRDNSEWSSAANFYLGYIAYSEGKYKEALSYFPAASQDAELGLAADYYTAQIYFAEREYNAALGMAQKLVKENNIGEFYGEACRIAGESLFNLGRGEEAIPYLRNYMATTNDPMPSASYILGVEEYKDGNYQQAIKNLGRASNQDNAMGQSANLYLGQSYVNLKKTDAALLCFEKAYRMGYDRDVAESALYNYAVAKNEGGRVPFTNSVALFENFLKEYPNSKYASTVREYMVSGYMSDNDYTQALRIIDSMKNPTPSMIRAKQECLFVIGTREYASGNVNSALSRFRQSALISNGDRSIYRQSLIWQGTCQYDLGQYQDAAKSFLTYIQSSNSKDENLALARYDLGYTRFAQQDYKSAFKDFCDVIDLHPEAKMLADAYNRAGDCLYYQSDFAGAENYYKKSYDILPSGGDYALFQQAVMKGLKRDYKGKIQLIDEMISKYPSSSLMPAAILEKAESYSSMGDNRGAMSSYKILINDYPGTSYGRKAALQSAITSLNMGNRNDAIEMYKYVISTYPTSSEAKLATDDLKTLYSETGQLNEFRNFLSAIPGAPVLDVSEMDALTFRAAETEYINKKSVKLLEQYVNEYPRGVYLPQAYFLLAENEYNNENLEKALDLASIVSEKYPDADVAADVLLIKAVSEEKTGKNNSALNSFLTLETKASSPGMLQQARMGILRNSYILEQYDLAIETAEKILNSPEHSMSDSNEVAFRHASALYKSGRKNEALTEWERISANPETLYGAQASIYLGEAQLAEGRASEAEKTANKLINANPPYHYWLARGFIVLSDALRAQGDDLEADAYLQSLKTNYPGNETDIFEMIDNRLK